MKNRFFNLIKNVLILILVLLYAYAIVCILKRNILYTDNTGDMVINRLYLAISLVYALIYYFMLKLFEADQIGRRRMLDIIYGHFASSICVNFSFVLLLLFVFGTFNIYMLLEIMGLCIGELLSALILILFLHRMYEKMHFTKKAIYIYQGDYGSFENNNIIKLINRHFKITNSMACDAIEEISAYVNDEEVVFIGNIDYEIRNQIIKKCMSSNIECYTFPTIPDVYIQNAKVMQLRDKLLLAFPNIGICGIRRVIKRTADIVIAFTLLLIMSPIMIAIAIAIKITDGGSVFYIQERVTLNNRDFHMLKFRSMVVDAEEAGATLARKNDKRITKIGKLIRNIHFDELPQLINVLKGDMSIVGPRPERRIFVDEYSKVVPEFKERLKVRGGLTGYAQIYGKYNTEPEDKLKYDLYYIYNYSLLLDVKILILTIRILFQPENTEGIENGCINALRKR